MCRRFAGAIDSEAAEEEEEMVSVVEKALGRCEGFAKEYDELYLTWLRLLCSAYVVEVQKLPLKKLKFLDESHFDTRGSESVP